MGGDDYVLDNNGNWNNPSDALNWYRSEVSRLRQEIEAATRIEHGKCINILEQIRDNMLITEAGKDLANDFILALKKGKSMAKKTVICDVCGIEIDAYSANYDVETEQDLCEKHYLERQLIDAKRDRDELAKWLEETHLKRLRELDTKIASLENEIDP